jgi:hypothetical protein
MKRILLLVIMAAIVMPAFVACKKGANDPSISLKSRNSRLIGKWKLTKVEGTNTYVSGGSTVTETHSFNGTIYTVTVSPGGGSGQATGSFEMEILKDGGYTFSESFTPSGSGTADISTGTSYWYWMGNDNSKVAVDFADGGSNLFGGGIYNVDKLSSKELILIWNSESTNNGDPDNSSFTYTFTAE